MVGKKAVELSLNFIVILIISIILFGFGVKFISSLFKEAGDITELTVNELDEHISNLICEGSDRVCIGIERKTILKGKYDVFGLKILNILLDQNFVISVSPPNPPNPIGYKKDNTPISSPPSPPLIINPPSRNVVIKQNEERSAGIGIGVPKNAVSGTYILNVNIIRTQTGEDYVKVQKLYVEVP